MGDGIAGIVIYRVIGKQGIAFFCFCVDCRSFLFSLQATLHQKDFFLGDRMDTFSCNHFFFLE